MSALRRRNTTCEALSEPRSDAAALLSRLAAFFASSSAISFPCTSMCRGTQRMTTSALPSCVRAAASSLSWKMSVNQWPSRSRVISEAWRAAVLAKAMDSRFHTTLVLVYCLRISMQR